MQLSKHRVAQGPCSEDEQKEPSAVRLWSPPLLVELKVLIFTPELKEINRIPMQVTPIKAIFVLKMNLSFPRHAKITPNKTQRGGFNILLLKITPQLFFNGTKMRSAAHNMCRSPLQRAGQWFPNTGTAQGQLLGHCSKPRAQPSKWVHKWGASESDSFISEKG